MFSNYLGSADPWKASPEDTAAYCASLADQGYSPHTIEAHLSSLTFHYERLGKGFEHGHMGKGIRKDNPVRTPLVRATMRGIKLVHIRPAVKMLPMMLDTLEKLIDVQPDTLIGFRNKALLSMSWAAALRASETSGLDISQNGGGNGYVEFTDDGIVVILKRSKMNLSGSHWERYGIPSRATAPRYCPRKLLQDWLDISGLTAGPLPPSVRCNYVNQPIRSERINIHTVTKIIRQGLTHLGLPPDQYGSRSLRSGCITWLIQEGVHPTRVMEHSGHRTLSVMLTYLRSVTSVATSPLAETRWCR